MITSKVRLLGSYQFVLLVTTYRDKFKPICLTLEVLNRSGKVTPINMLDLIYGEVFIAFNPFMMQIYKNIFIYKNKPLIKIN